MTYASNPVTTLNRADLVKALAALNRIVEKRNTIPILSFVRFVVAKDGVAITGTDLDTAITVQLLPAVKFKQGAVFTLNCAKLLEVSRKSKAEHVEFFPSPDEDLGRIKVRLGTLDLTLDTLPVFDFPEIEAGKTDVHFPIDALTLLDMFTRTVPCISTEETRYYLNGCLMHRPHASKKFRIVATDCHRLGRCETGLPAGAEKWPDSIVRARAVEAVMAACKTFADDTVEVSHGRRDGGAHCVTFNVGNITIVTKPIEGTFPDYGRVVPTGNDKTLCLDRLEAIAAIKEVSSISSERGQAVKMTMNGRTTFSVHNHDTGTSSLTIDGELLEPDGMANSKPAMMDIGFNVKYLLSILDSIRSPAVLLTLADPGSPVLFTGTGSADKGVLHVTMPMRV
jgi:DNA polymerase-3 subunit beta